MASPIQRVFAQVHSTKGLAFPNTVAALVALGVTRYHVDYTGQCVTAYTQSPGQVERMPFPAPIVQPEATWHTDGVARALRRVQTGETKYDEFAQECVDAGVCGYFAFLTGKNVLYYGSQGQVHVERFPGTVAKNAD